MFPGQHMIREPAAWVFVQDDISLFLPLCKSQNANLSRQTGGARNGVSGVVATSGEVYLSSSVDD
jgi:hypothetical protein